MQRGHQQARRGEIKFDLGELLKVALQVGGHVDDNNIRCEGRSRPASLSNATFDMIGASVLQCSA